MKTRVAFALLASSLLPTLDPASAASPAYCALYAREYSAARVGDSAEPGAVGARQRVEDQAYYRCLNLDEEPEFPTTSAYFGESVDDVIAGVEGVGGPFEELSEGDAAVDDEVPDVPSADAPPAPKPAKVASAAPGAKGPAPSGLKQWSPEWTTWCKAHYKSFNATTGMVVTLSGTRRLCP